jgi:lipopolysaccharide/colanic/teichoic acid biosynthesis glycosyltransferase
LTNRLVDIAAATLGLLLLMPLLFALSALIVIADGPPIFYSQIRVGKKGKLFRIWKFRTMRPHSHGRPITVTGDSRVTPLGAVLRRFKLDELPQLLNVLKGDMGLIGPRPEIPEFVSMGTPIWQAVLQVRPGVTDLATLLFRDEEQLLRASNDPIAFYRETVLPAKLVLNLRYLRYRSFGRDLKLLLLTVVYSLFPKTLDPDCIKRTVAPES